MIPQTTPLKMGFLFSSFSVTLPVFYSGFQQLFNVERYFHYPFCSSFGLLGIRQLDAKLN